MALDAASAPVEDYIVLPLARGESGLWVSDWSPLLTMLKVPSLSVRERGTLFHSSLAEAIVAQAEQLRVEHDMKQIGLAGGVFQNRFLAETAMAWLENQGFWVFLLPRFRPIAGLGSEQIIGPQGLNTR